MKELVETQPPKHVPRGQQKSDFKFSFKSPKYSRFCKSKKGDSPAHKFFNWVLTQMGEEVGGKKFTIDVSSVWISEKDAKEFKNELAKWVKKTKPHHTMSYCRQAADWLWLDIGPAQFHRGLPDWAEEGKIYVEKTWKKPPNVRIEGYGKFFINGIKATEKEVERLKKKYGDELRVHDKSRGF